MKNCAFKFCATLFSATFMYGALASAELNFDEAYKAGKPLSAEAAYNKDMKAGVDVPVLRHYQAAEVAAQIGKPTLQRDRLMLFLRTETKWNEQVESALWTLMLNGTDVELFGRLAKNVEPSRILWQAGIDMLNRLKAAKRNLEVIALADIMFGKFKEDWQINETLRLVYENAEQPTYPTKELVEMIGRHGNLSKSVPYFYYLVDGRHRDAFGFDFVINYMAKYGGEVSDDVLWSGITKLNNDAIVKTTNTVLQARRDVCAKNLAKLKDLCFDGKHPRASVEYVRASVLRLPKLFWPSVATNGVVAGSAALVKKLMADPRYTEKTIYGRKSDYRQWADNVLVDAAGANRFTPQETTAFVDADEDTFSIWWLCTRSSLGDVIAEVRKTKSLAPLRKLGAKFPKRADSIYADYFSLICSTDQGAADFALLKSTFLNIVRWDRNFGNHFIHWIANDAVKVGVPERLDLLKTAYTITGYSRPWKDFCATVSKEKDEKRFYGQPSVKAFAATIKEGTKPGDPFQRIWIDMGAAKSASEAHTLTAELNKAYPCKWGESQNDRENRDFNGIMRCYREIVWKGAKTDDFRKYLDYYLSKFGKYGADDHYTISEMLRKINDPKLWFAYNQKWAELTKSHNPYYRMCVAKGAEKLFDGIDLSKMDDGAAFSYTYDNINNLGKIEAKCDLLLKFLETHPLKATTEDRMFDCCLRLASDFSYVNKAVNQDFVKRFPIEKVADAVFAKKYPTWSWEVVRCLLAVAQRKGSFPQIKDRFIAWANQHDPAYRLSLYSGILLTAQYVVPPSGDNKNEVWVYILDEKGFGEVLQKQCLPTLTAIPTRQAAMVTWISNDFWGRLQDVRTRATDPKAGNPETVKLADEVFSNYLRLIEAGATRADSEAKSVAWHKRLADALTAGDSLAVARCARLAGYSVQNWRTRDEDVKATFDAFKKSGLDESAYLYADAMTSKQDNQPSAAVLAMAVKVRADLSSKLPGIYPVNADDPAYPLYVAAEELSRRNLEHAWQILKDPKIQPVFEREALKLPPDFMIWGVEQMRVARGEEDKLLLKARQIATAAIAQEGRVAPDVIAAMMLSRAEGYRDQQNFEAARLDYQSIRDNPVYHSTKYGKQAMFRAMDLQIESGNSQNVEQTLEYWMSQNDREVQTEAHYFLAKLAFLRKDYDECIKQLRQVFAINFTHTGARFLHGEWKLATNSEVDETEVLVGKLGDRNMIKPGNQFTITVQDANLSVAGDGAAIPLIVKAEPGGDKEFINLYPTTRDPTTFKGVVEVVLAKACPSNRTLEVRGDDTVSYVIDPEFLKTRGLAPNNPKCLSVVDDGKLAVGAGAPRTEEKNTEKGVKDLLDESQNVSSAVARQLRPGNPLYVVVQDRDRSHGGTNDSVMVSFETSSGDRVSGFRLKEEKPFSGVFRGKIETSLPPPRAFASDSAVGMNAGDVINSNKHDGWKSISDGKPGKWFEVDTMSSHLFSEIELETPSVENIKAIKLVGRMGKKTLPLGQIPEIPEASKLYLRCQRQYSAAQKAISLLRAFCNTDKAAKPVIVSNLNFRVIKAGEQNRTQTAFFSGPLEIPEGVDALRFRVVPVSGKKDALRDLWLSIVVDGEEIFSGQGCNLQNAIVTSDIIAGCHRFELGVSAASFNDEFDLKWEPLGQDPVDVPADWFDAEKHETIKEFVKDLAKITRIPNGFKASFEKPVRLRSFRWGFSDVKSPEVAVTRISAKDAAGETVLPVASEFSMSQRNDKLEVAPGDRVMVTYEDESTTSGDKKILQRQMSVSFTDGRISFIYEDADENGTIRPYQALRFRPGDSLVLSVQDSDCDVTDAADGLEVEVKDRLGKASKRKLMEFAPKWANVEDEEGVHTGVFMGILKTCREGDTNAPPTTLRVKDDDFLSVEYEDRENTDPGVPAPRETSIFAVRAAVPEITLFNLIKEREVDHSSDAAEKLERIRRRAGNENVEALYRDVFIAKPMDKSQSDSTEDIPMNVSAGAIPIRVNDRSRALHTGSKILVEAVAHSEIAKAKAEGRQPEKVVIPLRLAGALSPFRVPGGGESTQQSYEKGTFNGVLKLSLGPVDPNTVKSLNAPKPLCVTGSDKVDIAVLSEDGQPVLKRTFKLVSDGEIDLRDSSFAASRTAAHVGESFYVVIDDPDRDDTDEHDHIEVDVQSSNSGIHRKMILSETLPHSGVFTGRIRPMMFGPEEQIPSVATGGVASVTETMAEDRFAVGYGDNVIFSYKDEKTLPWTPARTLSATGTVFRGANGNVRVFSKRFADRDMAVLVQFRLAECLFEQAKEHRKLKQPEKSAAAIAEGKFILEEALKNYPDSTHVVQGEFLLANLYQELAMEQKDAGKMDLATPIFQEALARFSQILGTWPDGEYAARSQYHKALCLEMLKDYNRASEEYVKMTYLYPESELVGEATIRLATYYYTKEKRYDVAGHIYRNFQQRFPQHAKAARSLFMAGSCYIKQGEVEALKLKKMKKAKTADEVLKQQETERKRVLCYNSALKTFESLVEQYHDAPPQLRAQTLYWAGDAGLHSGEYAKSYKNLKKVIFEYPETEWARRARGLLLQEGGKFKGL